MSSRFDPFSFFRRPKAPPFVRDVYDAASKDEWCSARLADVYRLVFEASGVKKGDSHFVYVQPSRARSEINEIATWISDRFGQPGTQVPVRTPFGYLSVKWDGWIVLFAYLANDEAGESVRDDFETNVAPLLWKEGTTGSRNLKLPPGPPPAPAAAAEVPAAGPAGMPPVDIPFMQEVMARAAAAEARAAAAEAREAAAREAAEARAASSPQVAAPAAPSVITSDLSRFTGKAKPFKKVNWRALGREVLDDELRPSDVFGGMIGRSPSMKRLFGNIEKFAPTTSAVLVYGETGTGKELVAEAIHGASKRKGKDYLAINCATMNDSTVEDQLFGHEKGAFTGATEKKAGYFEAASGGTVFLDEIGELPLGQQSKLLRVLQSGDILRVGGTKPVKVDVRVVAATHRNLEEMVKQGTFREDLYNRLVQFKLNVPPLRDRPYDILVVAKETIKRLAEKEGLPLKKLSKGAKEAILDQDWTGNVRQLQNVLRQACVLSEGEQIEAEDIISALGMAYDVPEVAEPAAPSIPAAPAEPAAPSFVDRIASAFGVGEKAAAEREEKERAEREEREAKERAAAEAAAAVEAAAIAERAAAAAVPVQAAAPETAGMKEKAEQPKVPDQIPLDRAVGTPDDWEVQSRRIGGELNAYVVDKDFNRISDVFDNMKDARAELKDMIARAKG